jgi:hypothetical protein
MHGMETGSPFPLRLIGAVITDRQNEKKLHEFFAEYRVHREWFELSPADAQRVWNVMQGLGRRPRNSEDGRLYAFPECLLEAAP